MPRERMKQKCDKRFLRLTKEGKRREADQLSEFVKAKVKVVSKRSKATVNKKLRNLKEQQSGKSKSTDQKKTDKFIK
jgi:hypothetical protein